MVQFNEGTKEDRIMTGEYDGKRFEVGSVKVKHNGNFDYWQGWFVIGLIPAKDSNGGGEVTLAFRKEEKAAKHLADFLNG